MTNLLLSAEKTILHIRRTNMKDNDFSNDNMIPFKALADKFKGSLFDGDSDDFESNEVTEALDKFSAILESALSKPFEPVSDDEIYEEIVDNYFTLIKELGIEKFDFFRFAEYEYSGEVIIDGKRYDFDAEFCHDDEDASGALCAIDSLISDLDDDEEKIFKKVEKMINIRNSENG